jgi:eukaryotic-like serine/threonine-protein kinase
MSGIQIQPAVFVAARYEITGPPIGKGGMGVVYKAYDKITRRHVALKTIWGTVNSTALELFEKEWGVLARLSHPNIVDILETGQFEDHGSQKPYFVMPLLPGVTLEELIKDASQRLTVDRIVDIILQACRGLQAAHDQGLIHRDVKPSNIFVLEDDSVKIIDFGVVHFADMTTMTGLKGSLHYLAPELLEGRPPSILSDLFSLGVVCYEAFTRRKPFDCPTEDETFRAIRTYIPPPVSEINSSVNELISRTVHKVMAKQPWHRFSTARELGEVLKKAQRNDLIEYFDQSKIQPRIERVKKAQSEGDFQFAKEILSELEAEGHMDVQISMLRIQLDEAIKHKTIRQLLESARTRIEEEEFPLALQKVQEVLEIDPTYADALHLKAEIEQQRNEKQIDNWYRLVHQHIDNQIFSQARLGLEEILRIRPADPRARGMLEQVDRQEKESIKIREEKEQLYQSALKCYQCGEISTALDKLERLLSLARQTSKTPNPEKEAQYQNLYNQIRSERETFRNAYTEARRYLEDKSFARALALCAEFLKKNPADPMFQALKLEVEERERQARSAAVADVNHRVELEADLDRKISILKEAADSYPGEPHFNEALKLIRGRRDLVNSIVNRSKQYEQNNQFNEALSQWDILRNIYPQYPGLDAEAQRLRLKREEQLREEAKSRWVRQIDQHLETGEYEKAQLTIQEALTEFPRDRELDSLEKLALQGIERRREAERHFSEGQSLCAGGMIADGLEHLRKAVELDNRNRVMRTALSDALLEHSRALLNEDWRQAQVLVREALQVDGSHPVARNLFVQLQDRERQAAIDACVYEARELQSSGDIQGALAKVREGVERHPNEARLSQLEHTLLNSLQVDSLEWQPDARNAGSPPVAGGHVGATNIALAPMVQPAPQPEPPEITNPTEVQTPVKKAPRRLKLRLPHLSAAQWCGIAAVPLLLIAALVVRHFFSVGKPHSVGVDLHANVAGATFTFDGQPAASSHVELASDRAHILEASYLGYRASVQKLPSSGSFPSTVEFQLTPVLSRMEFTSNLQAGAISIGDTPALSLQDGGFTTDQLSAGVVVLKVSDESQQLLRLPLNVEAGKAVTLSGKFDASNCSVAIVSVLGSHARVYATSDLARSSGQMAPQAIPPEGVEVDTTAGVVEFGFNNGHTVAIQASNTPSLQIWMRSNAEATLKIQSNAHNARVKIDGQLQRDIALTHNTAMVSLPSGRHTIQVVADGFEASEEREINFAKGQTIFQNFKLHPSPAHLELHVEAASELYVDGRDQERVPESGIMIIDLEAGEHRVRLKKSQYLDSPELTLTLRAGQSLFLSAKELPLVKQGMLKFKISPSNAIVTYHSGNQPQHEARVNETVFVKPDTYTVHVEAPGHAPVTKDFVVTSGQSTDVSMALSSIETRASASTPSNSGLFEDESQWHRDGDWWIFTRQHTYGWLRPFRGVLGLTIRKKKSFLGKTRKVEWAVDFRSDREKALYWIENNTFHRQRSRDGINNSPEVKVPLKNPAAEAYDLTFDISASRIIVTDSVGNKLDELDWSDSTVGAGKVGFLGEISVIVNRVR